MLIPCVSSCCFPFSFSDSQDAVGLCAAIWEVHRFLLLMLRLKERFNLAFFLVVFLFYLFFVPVKWNSGEGSSVWIEIDDYTKLCHLSLSVAAACSIKPCAIQLPSVQLFSAGSGGTDNSIEAIPLQLFLAFP